MEDAPQYDTDEPPPPNRFLDKTSHNQDGYQVRRRCWWALTVSEMVIGDGQDEWLAITDNAGNIVTQKELLEIWDAVRPFYDRVSPKSIERFNNRPPQIDTNEYQQTESKPKTHTGFVYLLKAGPYYKVGASNDPAKRFDQLATLPPFDIELLHTIEAENMYALESFLHDRFADKRKNGEWFELDTDDVEYIKGL